jgi:hypothetical protein
MTTTAQLTRADLDKAIEMATPHIGKSLKGLNAPPNGAAAGMFDEIWGTVISGLRRAYEAGATKAREIAGLAVTTAQRVIDQAGEAADWLREKLREALQKLVRSCIELAVASIALSYSIEGVMLRLKSIEIGQTITLSGEVEASIQRVFSLMADGELSVSASYEQGTA